LNSRNEDKTHEQSKNKVIKANELSVYDMTGGRQNDARMEIL